MKKINLSVKVSAFDIHKYFYKCVSVENLWHGIYENKSPHPSLYISFKNKNLKQNYLNKSLRIPISFLFLLK